MSVCLFAAVRSHYCTDPDVTWERGRPCPLVVQYWADLQSVHGLRCYGNITRTLHGYKPASIPRYDDIVRTLGGVCARCWPLTGRWLAGDEGRSQNCAPYMGTGRGWLAGDWPWTGGVLNITAAAWTAGFHWWRSGNITRTQNVGEYMLVLALCLVYIFTQTLQSPNIYMHIYTHQT